ncbi:MAG: Asp-tRNA(Asn)/Glu-tRNA(Gln) amidotransferase subunit GatB [Caldicoprobacter oshimai]|uniref:Aspartyl/glutamyl-tRNA(Asn/Gln) amidotransferase subunit B n=1 Tax=Caldicoprobacter faecalis TaxID=937334 RepID=A0A1I5WES9_9FIRM|nr:Asp-tRNA(Asn)/Glu-tRNA(Gln) amidotransferase subunit GatB [Caldicoprobacter faecalis]PZN10337.1 MAG: Asp-tRNA(Asn)/Glu-tRNA(Gln) amidotransferase subunit GatB [Caldicoprobacter oshimai]SFQ18323.1 aspartyl/glutamyl-tRNA(Asn/Gln) amidotransferase subunit B [Caldicoprobacter faecalis]
MKYEVVIGLEVHAELSTQSKAFCGCSTKFGAAPNTQCCPVCIGMPGVLPVINKKALEYTIKAGLALNCRIARYTKMDRKNYFYPDLPRACQISQYDVPVCQNGYLDIVVNGQTRRIGINRIHLEEDAGKLLHDQYADSTLVDLNRSGVPLIEIVTEPDLRSAEEAKVFLETLRSILRYIDVSDCKMEEGSLRCDVNISVRPEGQKEFGVRTEMKNLNSFRAVYRAIEYEANRQISILEEGGTVLRETRRWDDSAGKSFSMRAKEHAQDYRYFPEPDLPPIEIDDEWVEEIRKQIPELPAQKQRRYVEEFGLPEYDAGILTSSRDLADYFERCVKLYENPKTISNWLMGDFLRLVNEKNIEISDVPVTPENLVKLFKLIDSKVISGPIAKTVFEEMFDTGKDPEAIVEEKGLKQITDRDELVKVIKKVLAENPKSVEDYKNGKKKALGFLVGQTMKATKGKANPQLVNEILLEELEK